MASDTEATLHYEPLDRSRKSIRLLEVFPGDGNDIVRCELVHADLDDNPSYIALSYTWNHDNMVEMVQCNNTSIEIGKNLFNFLHRYRVGMRLREHIILQDREASSERRWSQKLWVDQICINQRDKEECNFQVALMGQIYAKTEFVIAWMGEPCGPEDEALLTTLPSTYQEAYAQKGNKTLDARLRRFLSKRYWTRMWTVQEFLIPDRLAIMCGSHIVDFATLDSLVGGRDFVDLVAKWLFTTRYIMQTAAPGNRYTLRDNMTRFSLNGCYLPRDRVYALLGLAEDANKGPNPIVPDYREEKTTIEVMVDVMRNQYGPRENVVGSLNHPVALKTLRRALQIKMLDVSRYIMQTSQNSNIRTNLYVLTSGMRVAAPLQCVGTITQVLDFSEDVLFERDIEQAKHCTGLWDSRTGVELEEGEAYAKLSLIPDGDVQKTIGNLIDFTAQGHEDTLYDSLEAANPAEALSRGILAEANQCYLLTGIKEASQTCKVLVGTNGIRGIIREDKTVRNGDRIAVHNVLPGGQYALVLRQTTKQKWIVIGHSYIWREDRVDTPVLDNTYRPGKQREFLNPGPVEINVCCDNDNDGLQILMLLSALKIIDEKRLTAILAEELEDSPEREHQCRTEKVPCDTIWLDRGLGDTPLFGLF